MLLSASTTTRADASVVTPAPGQELTLLAVVASSSGTPTGHVTFYDGSTNLGPAPLNGGIARLTVASGLALGANSIQAEYSGDGNFATSTGNLTLTVAAPANDVVTNQLDSVPQTAADQSAPLPDNTDQLVRYADGVVTVSQDGPSSSGFGFPWAQTISWSNGPGYSNGTNGNGWVDTSTPELLQADGQTSNTLVLVSNGNTASYFNSVNGSYQASFADTSKLTYNSSSDTYTLLDPVGDQIVFNGFGQTWQPAERGQFQKDIDADGVILNVTYSPTTGNITEMQRSVTIGSNTTTESWLYSYLTSGPNTGLLSNVTLGTQVNGGTLTKIRQVQYTYYDGTQQYGGNIGDLMTATIEDGSNTPNVLDTSYYRYYTSNSSSGYTHGLEYVFSPDSYLRMTAAPGNQSISLGNLTDAQVAPYADNYFQYNGAHQVSQETVQGGDSQTKTSIGLATYNFNYALPSTNPQGTNDWSNETTVTNPDGSTDTVFTNYCGEVILDAHWDPSSKVTTENYYEYNLQGQLYVQAAPSAVTAYSASYSDVVGYANGALPDVNYYSGLITYYEYFTSTTATETSPGTVAGYLGEEILAQGLAGPTSREEYWTYYAHALAGQTIAPLATDSVFRNSDGSNAETTSYTYSWYPGTAQMHSETDTAPVISSGQNGPGEADVTTTYFDSYGNAQWIKDPDGYLQYFTYDPATGAQTEQIVDVNTVDSSEFTNLPTGWSTPSTGGLNLITTDVVDDLGRTTEETSPNGNITYYVYLDPQHEERIYQGWKVGSGGSPPSVTAPIQVIHHDATDGYDETFTMTAAPSAPQGVPDGKEAISNLQTLTRDYFNAAGQVVSEDAFFNFGTLTYNTLSQAQVNVNYYLTTYGYDSDGNLVETVTPNGTIYRTVYNSLGEKVSDWVGTNDTPTSGEWSPNNNKSPCNMVMVSSYQYDNGGVGDGNLTQEIDYPGLSQPARETDSWYDWRDRLVAQKSGVESQQIEQSDGVNRPIIVTTYDNLDEVTETQQYLGDGVTPTISKGVLSPLAANSLRAQEIDSYDDQGRVYQKQVYDVNPTNGNFPTTTLTTNYYRDLRGDLIAESAPGGLWTKSQYDGAGRDYLDYTTDGGGETSWDAAASVSGDTVLEQDQTVYDKDGNVIETIDSQRFDSVTGHGALAPSPSGVQARVYYTASYYDNADRKTADVNVGNNAGAAWTPPGSVPTSTATVLVTAYAYNSMGLVQQATDPMGVKTFTVYDNLGRTIKTIQNYTGAAETTSSDIATEYGYDGNGNVLYVQADEPNNAYQKTTYVYGVTTGAGLSGVNSNDILSAVVYPDPSTGQPSTDPHQKETYLVNALGQNVQYTDRNGTVHQYSYDVLGRETADTVTQFATGVDPTVKQHTYAYDSQGNQYLISSLNASGGVVNQVEDVYNGLDQLTGEYQSHSGAVSPGTTPEVQYAYTELTAGNNSRLTSVTYPDKYILDYNYNSGLDSNISRLSSLVEDSTKLTLESYLYLGLDTVVERDHPQIKVNQTFIATQQGQTGDGGDKYVGLDRFGRVADQNWFNTNTSQSTDNFAYSYDPDGAVLTNQSLIGPKLEEFYQYDKLHRLTLFERTTSDIQTWTLDALGNFTSVSTDGPTDNRTITQQNQDTNISGYGSIGYDNNGNLTTDNADGDTLTYDAWNRLVIVSNGLTAVTYSYDGLGRLIFENNQAASTTLDQYYSSSGQVLEAYINNEPQARYVWSPVYVNALVLRDRSSNNDGKLSEERLYVQQDANWNVTALVNLSGSVVERYQYLPYGAVTVLTPNFAIYDLNSYADDPYAMRYLWQGMQYDADPVLQEKTMQDTETYLYFSQWGRADSPELLQTWLQTDPSGLSAGPNGYAIENNNPANEVDPSGLRGLKTSEKTSVAVFLNSVFPLTQREFSTVIGAQVEVGGLEDITDLITKSLKEHPVVTLGTGTIGQLVARISLHYKQADAVTLPAILTGFKRTIINTKNGPPNPEPKAGVIDVDALALISHELVHAIQIERGGGMGAGFLKSYLADYAQLTLSGVIGNDAYRYNRYEIEAYSAQIAIQKVLGNDNSKRLFQKVMKAYTDKNALGLINNDQDAKMLSQLFMAAYKTEYAAEWTQRNAIISRAKARRNMWLNVISPGLGDFFGK